MTESIDEAVWQKRARVLAGQLVDAGVLTDSRWRATFTQTPRHVFVPRFYRDDHTIIDGTDPAETDEWLDGVYSDDSLVLRMLGYYPSLAIGDGAAGVPTGAPYDRILATCAVSAIPPAWIDQLAPGGRIVTDLRGEMSSSLAVLDKTAPGVVRGRLLEQPGHFMWLRPDPDNPLLDADRFNFVVNHGEADTSTTDLDPRILDEPGLRVLLGILEPTLSTPSMIQRNGTTRWMHADGGSWVEITGQTVIQGGPRRLWPAVKHAVAEWRRLGTPGRGHYRLTATAEGDHHYSVDTAGERRLVEGVPATGSSPMTVPAPRSP